jgi:hypothetical protein
VVQAPEGGAVRTNSASAGPLMLIAENRPHLCDPVHTGSYFQLRAGGPNRAAIGLRAIRSVAREKCPAGGLKESWHQAPSCLRRGAFQRRRPAGIEDAERCTFCVRCIAKLAAIVYLNLRYVSAGPDNDFSQPAARHKFIIILIRYQCPHRCHSECRMDILSHHVTYTFALAISTAGGGTTGGTGGMTSQLSSE